MDPRHRTLLVPVLLGMLAAAGAVAAEEPLAPDETPGSKVTEPTQ